jgi:ABC-2 type transport system permease protein
MQQGAVVLQDLFNNPAQSQARVRTMLGELQRSSGGDTQPELERFLGQLDTFLGSQAAQPSAAAAGTAPGEGWQPLRVTRHELMRQRTGPTSGYDITFPQAMIWAIFGCVMTFGGSFVTERVRGTFIRLQVSPMSRGQILAGKSLAAFLAIVGVQSVVLLLGVTAFGVRVQAWLWLIAAVVSAAVAFVGIILMLASTLKTEHAVGGIGPAVMMPLFMLGGAMIPLMMMPEWMLSISHISPVKWAILAFEGAIWRGFGPIEMLLPCAVLLGVGVVTFVLGSRLSD